MTEGTSGSCTGRRLAGVLSWRADRSPNAVSESSLPFAEHGPTTDDPSAEPTLAGYWRGRWRSASPLRRSLLAAAAVVFVAVAGWGGSAVLTNQEPGPEPPAATDDVERNLAAWASLLRQTPAPVDSFALGRLEPGDALVDALHYADYYVYESTGGVPVEVSVTTAHFAPDVWVVTPSGRQLGATRLRRSATRAEVSGLYEAGRYEIAVTSRDVGGFGDYELSVGAPGWVATLTPSDSAVTGGVLGEGMLRAGRFEARYAVSAPLGRPMIVTVGSSDFQPRLELLGPSGEMREAWGSVEERSDGEERRAVLRYRAAWDAPYTLRVSSRETGRGGEFTVRVQEATITRLPLSGRMIQGTWGDESWMTAGRYLDGYRFDAPPGRSLTVAASSEETTPALRLWRVGSSTDRLVQETSGEDGEAGLTVDSLSGGGYVLEVLTPEGNDPPPPATYSLAATLSGRAPRLGRRAFSVDASGSATTADGHTFTVRVTAATVETRGGLTQVRLAVEVVSHDYAGPWAPWRRFATLSRLTDDRGLRFEPRPAESRSGSAVVAEPGSVRRGTLLFVGPGPAEAIGRLALTTPLSRRGDAAVRLRIRVPR